MFCTKFLQLKHNAKICEKCELGLYPIHIAAQNGSEDVLDMLLEQGNTS